MSERNIRKTDEQKSREAAGAFLTILMTFFGIVIGIVLLVPNKVLLPTLALLAITMLMVLVIWFRSGD